jgi:hypothetical protein
MVFRLPPREESRRRRRAFSAERRDQELERRQLLSTTTPAPVVMGSATTVNSHSVTIDYNVVTPPTADSPLSFGTYRSASRTFDANAIAVGSEAIQTGATPTLDDSGQPAGAVGNHQLTIALPNGLPLNPLHPNVLVVADPTTAIASTNAQMTASFHVDTIVVVTHGGIQFHRYNTTGPPWQQIMAASLRQQGYDTVIPFVWVVESNSPGEAALQAPRLVRNVLAAAARFPANDVVDIQFIGHSEGAVVNDQAIIQLEAKITPQIKAGWLEDTMLDPHAANTSAPGQQYSVANNMLGWIAKGEIDQYQAKAKDPLVSVPAGVDSAQVFYQHTTASKAGAIYNLWGEVPVKGPAVYYNLTAAGVVHAGDATNGMPEWYERNVVPTLGNGAAAVAANALTGAAVVGNNPAYPHQPTFSGTIAPGSFVKVMVARASDPNDLVTDGRTVAAADGTWSITGRPLYNGRYRVLAEALPPRGVRPRLAVVPTAPLGTIVVKA